MPEVKVPELAESITEGTIAEWLKNVGDSVEKGEAILELETDKVNVEVVSEEAGVLSEQLASEGDTVEVGQAIAVIGEGSGNASKENSNDNTPQQNDETTNNKKEETTNKLADKAEVNQTTDDNQQRVNATPSAASICS
ncbi:dihydrolipoamide succinyltransferase E2 component of 2-oxoglutarate dehydrogenase complex [Staphylococcus aureus]|uniref:Dihydrolipoamide succinyltransferase E2 component of 2-oxoglutarate dehydrogenase complex n=1 Tax=Staphylococcus aureus TaxID=1280 RepID=A0A380E3D3_STAAU|nr:dihydrolipoamide succinyltransferase E2 component of 2-oxoglutarate dehydrogenase complex [Staphylococcus aureus]